MRLNWSKEEDEILKQQIGIHGIPKWKVISKAFISKNSKQCRHRWYNYLNFGIKKTDWTHEEDNLLLQSQRKLGNKWIRVQLNFLN